MVLKIKFIFISMKLLINKEQLISLKSRDEIPLECEWCKNTFTSTKNQVLAALQPERKNRLRFCSKACAQRKEKQISKCFLCGTEKLTRPFQRKGKQFFCSKPCRATWYNAHKTWGSPRSKLEIWIEKELTKNFPNLHIDYNNRDEVNNELDIYIPSLKLAFEINGIFHYKSIHGDKRLKNAQKNDAQKVQICLEKNIELCVIDTYNSKYFKKERDKKFLEIIENLIRSKQAPIFNRTDPPLQEVSK